QDGSLVAAPLYGVEIPIDPGEHRFNALAPGHLPWTQLVSIDANAATTTLKVPPLKRSREPSAGNAESNRSATPSSSTARSVTLPAGDALRDAKPGSTGTGQRVLGLTVGGFGLAGLAVSGVLALKAKSKNQESLQTEYCRTESFCTPEGIERRNQARELAKASGYALAGGGILLLSAAILVLTAPSSPTPNVASVSVEVDPARMQAHVQARF
ncbi:MAG TPA: hypothetical protein VK524_28955, partial [Polyangiaceae bacterium]|nr:hypothetical protein [Polyangiaceae bacterium]